MSRFQTQTLPGFTGAVGTVSFPPRPNPFEVIALTCLCDNGGADVVSMELRVVSGGGVINARIIAAAGNIPAGDDPIVAFNQSQQNSYNASTLRLMIPIPQEMIIRSEDSLQLWVVGPGVAAGVVVSDITLTLRELPLPGRKPRKGGLGGMIALLIVAFCLSSCSAGRDIQTENTADLTAKPRPDSRRQFDKNEGWNHGPAHFGDFELTRIPEKEK